MKMFILMLVGLTLGLLAGGAIGIGAGLAWISAFHTSNFEGYSGMLVFFTFMPVGAIVGGVAGAAGLGWAGRDTDPSSPHKAAK